MQLLFPVVKASVALWGWGCWKQQWRTYHAYTMATLLDRHAVNLPRRGILVLFDLAVVECGRVYFINNYALKICNKGKLSYDSPLFGYSSDILSVSLGRRVSRVFISKSPR